VEIWLIQQIERMDEITMHQIVNNILVNMICRSYCEFRLFE
jgi:hypothetical protein